MFDGKFSRPDFHLFELQVELGAIVIVGNDEYAHRRYGRDCEFKRMLKISSALNMCPEFEMAPIIYIRFNPHHYMMGPTLFDPSLETRHAELRKLIINLKEMRLNLPNGLNIIYMYYDRDASDKLKVLETLKENDVENISECIMDIHE